MMCVLASINPFGSIASHSIFKKKDVFWENNIVV